MGVDAYKTSNSESYAIVVIKKDEDDIKTVVAHYKSHDEKDYKAEIKRLSDFYKIPEDKILKEIA